MAGQVGKWWVSRKRRLQIAPWARNAVTIKAIVKAICASFASQGNGVVEHIRTHTCTCRRIRLHSCTYISKTCNALVPWWGREEGGQAQEKKRQEEGHTKGREKNGQGIRKNGKGSRKQR